MKISSGGVTGLLSFLDTLQQGKAQRQQQQQQFSQEKLQSEQRMAESRRADATYQRGVEADKRQIDQYNRELEDWKKNAPVRDLTRATSLFDLKAKLPKERLGLKTQWMEYEGKQKEALKPLLAKLSDRNLTPGNEAIIRGQIQDIVTSVADAKKLFGEHASSLNLGDIFSDAKWEAPDLLSLTKSPNEPALPVGGNVPNVGMDQGDVYDWMNPPQPKPVPTETQPVTGMGAPASTGMGAPAGVSVGLPANVATGTNTGMGAGMNVPAPNAAPPPPPPATGEITPPVKPEPVKIQPVSVTDVLAGKGYNIEKDKTLTPEDRKSIRTLLKDRGINEYELGAYDYVPAKFDPKGGAFTKPDGSVSKVGDLIPASLKFNPVKATRIALPLMVNGIRDWAAQNKMTPYEAQFALGLEDPSIQLFTEKGEPRLKDLLADNTAATNLIMSIYNRAPDILNATEDSRKRAADTAKDSLKSAEAFMEGVRTELKQDFEKEQNRLNRAARNVETKNAAENEVLSVAVDSIGSARASAYKKQSTYENWSTKLVTATDDAKTAILKEAGIIDGKLPSGVTIEEMAGAFSTYSSAIDAARKQQENYPLTSSLKSLQVLQGRMGEITTVAGKKLKASAFYRSASKPLKAVLDTMATRVE